MKKQFRVQLDFTVEADEAAIQFDDTLWTERPDDAWIQTRMARQSSLFRAVLSHPALLQRYLQWLIFEEFVVANEQTWSDLFGLEDSDFEKILLPAIALLNVSEKK